MNLCIILFILIHSTSTLTLTTQINVIVDEITQGGRKNYRINSTTEYMISFAGLPMDLSRSPPRIYLECIDCNRLSPAIIVVKEKSGVTSLQLPIVLKLSDQSEIIYNKTEKTLCPYQEANSWKGDKCDIGGSYLATDDENSTLIVSLSTSSKKNITVCLELVLVTDFLLQLDTNRTITLTPPSPSFYLFEFPHNFTGKIVVLEVESEFNNCMILSVQNKSCPIIETGFVYYSGYFQTVTRLGGMTVRRDMFPLGFYVVLSLRADDSYCYSSTSLRDSQRVKTVVVSVNKSVSTEQYLHVVLGTLGVIVLVYALLISITFYFMRMDSGVPELENCDYEEQPSASVGVLRASTLNDSNIVLSLNASSSTGEDTLSIKTDSSLDEIDVDLLTDAELDKNIFRTKVTLYLSDLAKKNPTVLKKKSELYFWNLMTVAIFYGLPAAQLVITYQYEFHNSGNEDLCYYNFLCSHPLGSIFDFNHFFSNIGYIALGVLFLIITHRKDALHRALICKNSSLERDYGVPRHSGLFYAMGTSLIIEGVLSACYHICPNIYNFQLDATFMYVISTLCMIKIYQSRHPDVNATAYSTFFLIGLVLFLEVCGVIISSSLFFWIIFSILHIGVILYISLHIYYVGRFDFDLRCMIRSFKEFHFGLCRTVKFWCPMYPKRFGLIAGMNLCNWGIAISALVIGVKDVSSYLLLIFITNLMLYTTFYIIMKILSDEKILFQPRIYIFVAVLFWSVALYYFFHKTISWKRTPAESRMFNKPCTLFNFYDNHDIWHFISSGGLFFSFLVLLTLDDDLIFIHRSKIPVF